MIHDLKIWPCFFEATATGLKTNEVRKNDRDYRRGDILNLREWDPETQKFTGRGISVEVTHVLDIHDLDAPLKSAMGLNPCTSQVNELAILSIRVNA